MVGEGCLATWACRSYFFCNERGIICGLHRYRLCRKSWIESRLSRMITYSHAFISCKSCSKIWTVNSFAVFCSNDHSTPCSFLASLAAKYEQWTALQLFVLTIIRRHVSSLRGAFIVCSLRMLSRTSLCEWCRHLEVNDVIGKNRLAKTNSVAVALKWRKHFPESAQTTGVDVSVLARVFSSWRCDD